MPDGSVPLIATLAVVLAGRFVNGWADGPDATAAVLSTRVLLPSQGVFVAAALNRTVISVALRIL